MVTPIHQAIYTSLTNAIVPPILEKLSADNPIFVACSGGRDSMALLYLLSRQNLPIVALHVNHRIQAPSVDWEALVRKFCHTHDIPFLAKQLAFLHPENVSEQQARNARYQAMVELIQAFYLQNDFSKVVFTSQTLDSHIRGNDGKIFKLMSPLRRQGSSALFKKPQVTHSVNFNKKYEKNFLPILALAHHANDQAETMLMNLCNGTGLQGLSGISVWTVQHQFGMPLGLWRPLLTVTREQISDYVTAQNLPYVDDPTNVTGDNQRAFLRQVIFPQLEKLGGNKGVVQNIARTSQNIAEASQMLDKQAEFLLKNCQKASWTTTVQCLDITKLCQISQAERFYLLHYWLKQQMTFAPPRRFIEQINQLILRDNPDQQTILQWENQQIRRYRDRLYLLSERYINLLKWAENCADEQGHMLENLAKTDTKKSMVNLARIEDFSLTISLNFTQIITQTIRIRRLKNGEKFQLINRNHHQSIKNICQTLAIPSWERTLVRVMACDVVQPRQPIALIFPTQTVWLAAGKSFTQNNVQMSFEKLP